MTKFLAACIQMRSTTSVRENCDTMESLVRKAAAEGASYVQTPEMTGLLERDRAAQFANTKPQDQDETFALAASLSKELGIWLHVGSTAIHLNGEKLANRAGVFSPQGKLVATYDKIHMFDVDLDNGESWRESKVYQPGETAALVDTGSYKLGLSICYDVRFPHLYREMGMAGAQVLAVPAAFTKQTGKAHWHNLLRSRAIECGAFVIAAAQGGLHEDGRETYGHSLIVNPWGEIIGELDHDEPGFLLANINLGDVSKARGKVPNLVNGRAFGLAEYG